MAVHSAAVLARSLLFLSGLRATQFTTLPDSKIANSKLISLVYNVFQYFLRLIRLLYYPHIFFRNLLAALVLQGVYKFIYYGIRRIRQMLYQNTLKGKEVLKLCTKMEKAEDYSEWRIANKEYLRIMHEKTETTPEISLVLEQLNNRFYRYRDYIRKDQLHRLQFELRSDLLRKHFGHDQHHPLVRDAIQRYVGIVSCAFHLLATGTIPESLHSLVYDIENVDIEDSLHQTNSTRRSMSDSMYDSDTDEETTAVSFSDQITTARSRLDFFAETRHSFGRSALLLSGGASMGFLHVGVIKTLLEHRLMPKVISGSSAGSIIAAALGCKTDEELVEVVYDPTRMNLRFFGRSDSIDSGLMSILNGDEPTPQVQEALIAAFTASDSGQQGLLGTLLLSLPPPYPSYILLLRKLLPRWFKDHVLLDIDILKQAIRNLIGDMTFQEAYDRTGRIINITATPHGSDRDVPLLLNYLTAPYTTVWSAACASCCIPGVFSPVSLVNKSIDGSFVAANSAGLRFVDGSLESDLPMQRLSELFNVNHFIVSQVNPHAQLLAPFQESDTDMMSLFDEKVLGYFGNAIRFCRDQGRSYVKHVAQAGISSSLMFPLGSSLVPLLVQKYSGDVTLYPKMTPKDLLSLLRNPSQDDYTRAIRSGEEMTWSKVTSIRRRCMIEYMLDDCVQAMREKIASLERRSTHSGLVSRFSSANLTLPDPKGITRKSSPTASSLSSPLLDEKLSQRFQSSLQLSSLVNNPPEKTLLREGLSTQHEQNEEESEDDNN